MIHLAYPFTTMTTIVALKDPEFSDVKAADVRVGVTTMMDGSMRTRRTTPATIKMKLRFIDVTRKKTLQVRDFVALAQGSPVRYVHYDDTHWKVYIITEPAEFTTTGRGLGSTELRPESNTFELTLEGVQIG